MTKTMERYLGSPSYSKAQLGSTGPLTGNCQLVDDGQQGFKQTIVSLTEQVLAAASFGDFDSYKKLVDFDATCFEPETYGSLMKGLEIHRFYFDSVLPKNSKTINTCMLNPVVHPLGPEAACIVYTRYTQYLDRKGMPHTLKTEETRIWHLKDDRWVNVHFHHS